MAELKKSPYKDVKAGLFASRARLCVHPNVKSGDRRLDIVANAKVKGAHIEIMCTS